MTVKVRTRATTRPKWDAETLDLGFMIADKLDPPQSPYIDDLDGWVEEELGEEVWSKQREILQSVNEHRKTGVWSCHSAGKSHIASRAIAGWLKTHPLDDLFIVTSAPSAPQVRGILWRYIKALHRKAGLPGYITGGEIPEWKIDGDLVGWGRKPANLSNEEEAKAVFQGIHAKYVLVVFDEADGIPKWLWDAAETLLTSTTNRLLAIGNPDNPNSHFAKIRRDAENDDWNKITITAFDTPAFTGEDVSDDLLEHILSVEWVEGVKREWGEDNPLYVSKVLAQYPAVSDDALITPIMIAKMKEAWELLPGDEVGRFAMDVARFGRDKTVIYRNRGGVLVKVDEWSKKDTEETSRRAETILKPHNGGVGMVIDIGGLGSGPFDNLRAWGYPVWGFDGSTRPWSDDHPRQDGLRFLNRRAEQYWTVREEADSYALAIDPTNLKAQAQLMNIKWDRTNTGRIFIEKKEEIKKRTGESPDDADAIMMSTVATDEWHIALERERVNSGPEKDRKKALASETADLLKRDF